MVVITVDPSIETGDNTPTIGGYVSLEAGDTLSVTVDGRGYTDGDGFLTVGPGDVWSLDIPEILTGVNDVDAIIIKPFDPAYPDSTTNELNVARVTVDFLNTVDSTPTLTGNVDLGPGDVFSVEVDSVVYPVGPNLSVLGDVWTLNVPATLGLGTYDVVATIVNGGAVTDFTTNELNVVLITVDKIVTNRALVELTGKININVGAGDTVSIQVDGKTFLTGNAFLTINEAAQTWNVQATASIPIYSYGIHDIDAVVTVGSVPHPDVTSAELEVVRFLIDGLVTTDSSPTITGAAYLAPGNSLIITVNGATFSSSDPELKYDSDNNRFTVDLPANPIGVYPLTGSLIGAAVSAFGTSLTIEGVSVDPLVTAYASPTITGKFTSSDYTHVRVLFDSVTYTSGSSLELTISGDTWSLEVPGPLALGTYDVVAETYNQAFNDANPGGEIFIFDSTSNEVEIVNDSIDYQTTVNTSPTITGTTRGSVLAIQVNGVPYFDTDPSVTLEPDGTWTLEHPTPLAPGSYNIVVTSDLGPNVYVDALIIKEFTVDELVTADSTPKVTGVAHLNEGEELYVVVNGVNYFSDDVAYNEFTNVWSLNVGIDLPFNIYEVSAQVVSGVVVIQDATNSEITIRTITVDFLATPDDTPTVTGMVQLEPGEFILVDINGFQFDQNAGDITYDQFTGIWSLNVPIPLNPGVYDVQASISGIYFDTTIDELTIMIVGVDFLTTASLEPTLTGVSRITAGDIFTVEVNGYTYFEGDGFLTIDFIAGTWSLNVNSILSPLSPNTVYDIIATVDAGSIFTDNTLNELSIVSITVDTLFTANQSPTITGEVDYSFGDFINVDVDGTLYTLGDGFLTVDETQGTWSLNAANNILSPGVYDVVATVNGDPDTTLDELNIVRVTVDEVITIDEFPTITGNSILMGDQLFVEIEGNFYQDGDPAFTLDPFTGAWSVFDPLIPYAPDTYDVTATIGDGFNVFATDPTSDELKIVLVTVDKLTTTLFSPTVTGNIVTNLGGIFKVEVDGNTYFEGGPELIVDYPGKTWTLTIPFINPGVYDVDAVIDAGSLFFDLTNSELEVCDLLMCPAFGCANSGEVEVTLPGQCCPTVCECQQGTCPPDPVCNVGEHLEVLNGECCNSCVCDVGTCPPFSCSLDGEIEVTAPGDCCPTSCTCSVGTCPPFSCSLDGEIEVTAPGDCCPTSCTCDVGTCPAFSCSLDGEIEVTAPGDCCPTSCTCDVGTCPAFSCSIVGEIEVTAPGECCPSSCTCDVGTCPAFSCPANEAEVTAPGDCCPTSCTTVLTVDSLTTTDFNPTVTGNIDASINTAGATLSVTVDGVVYAGVITGNTWSLDLTAIPSGTYDVQADLTVGLNTYNDITTDELTINCPVLSCDPATEITSGIIPATNCLECQVVNTIDFLSTTEYTPTITGSIIDIQSNGGVISIEVDGATYFSVFTGTVWSVDVTAPIAPGVYDISATFTAFGTVTKQDVTTNELTITCGTSACGPNEAPSPDAFGCPVLCDAVVIVDLLATGDTTPTLTGSINAGVSTAGGSIDVTVDGNTYSAVIVGQTWSVDVTNPVGVLILHDVEVSFTDSGLNVYNDLTNDELFIVVVPTVDILSVAETNQIFTGKIGVTSAGSVMTVEIDGTVYPVGPLLTIVTDDWTLDLTSTPLVPGQYDVIAKSFSPLYGEFVDTTSNEVTVLCPLICPANQVPGATDVNGCATSCVSAVIVDVLAATTPTPTLTGSIDSALPTAGGSLSITVDGSVYSATIVGQTWSADVTSGLIPGTYEVQATFTDSLTNTYDDETTDELTVACQVVCDDNQQFIFPFVFGCPTGCNDIVLVDQLTTSNFSPLITGTIEPTFDTTGYTLEIEIAGDTYSGTIVGNTWSAQVTGFVIQGPKDVIATITSPGLTFEYTDRTTNELTISCPNIACDSNTEIFYVENQFEACAECTTVVFVDPLSTDDDTPTITGTIGAGFSDGTIFVTIDGNTQSAPFTGGVWSIDFATPLSVGFHDVVASFTPPFYTARVDTTLNELEITCQACEPDEFSSGVDGSGCDICVPIVTVDALTTFDQSPTITGTVEASSIGSGDFRVTVNDVEYSTPPLVPGPLDIVVVIGNTWSLEIPSDIPWDLYDVKARITGDAIVGGPPNSYPYTVLFSDKTIGELEVTNDPGRPTVNFVTTNHIYPQLSGYVPNLAAGQPFEIVIDGTTTIGTSNADFTIVGNEWTFANGATTAGVQFLPGSTDIVAQISILIPFTGYVPSIFDVTTNEITVVATPTVDKLSTTDSTPSITGTVNLDNLGTFDVTVNSVTYPYPGLDLSVTAGGDFTLQIPVGNAIVTPGKYSVTATRVESGGFLDIDDLTSNELHIMDIPTVTSATIDDYTPTISGTIDIPIVDYGFEVAVGGETYVLEIDTGLSVDPVSGTWALTTDTLNTGVYDVSATVTIVSSGDTVSDNTIDELTVIDPFDRITVDLLTTSDLTPTITGTIHVPALDSGFPPIPYVLRVRIDGVEYRQPQLVAGPLDLVIVDEILGTWSLDLPATAPGTYDAEARITGDAIIGGPPGSYPFVVLFEDDTTDEITITPP
jgi:hypothetical protein